MGWQGGDTLSAEDQVGCSWVGDGDPARWGDFPAGGAHLVRTGQFSG